MRRTYISNLSEKNLRCSVNKFDQLSQFFNNDSLYLFQAQIDIKILEATIVALSDEDVQELQSMYTDQNLPIHFATKIVNLFMGDVLHKEIDKPLRAMQWRFLRKSASLRTNLCCRWHFTHKYRKCIREGRMSRCRLIEIGSRISF